MFCCSVPLTTMRPPRPIWLNLPLMQRVGMPRAWVTGRELDKDVNVRGLHFVEVRERQRASHGPKRSDASVPHVFPKPISKVGDKPRRLPNWRDDPRERTLSGLLYPTSDPNES
ncbi:hypothetical protein TNCV_3655131 [Trichonephila clavipes]|nr:hypothetical protein TNCV_3655131 [Trichonephila clavipes]